MNSKLLIITFVVLLATNYVNCLNILAIFLYPGASHFYVYRVYLQELANRGHNLTVISHFPNVKPIKNYHDIDISDITAKPAPPFKGHSFPFLKSYIATTLRAISLMNSGTDSCKVMMANKKVQELIARKPKFDVAVVEQFNTDCALGVAFKLQAPVVGITSYLAMPWHYSRFGIPQNPSFVPMHYTHGGTKPSLLQKMEVTIFQLYFKTLHYLYGQRSDQHTLAEYFDGIPPLESLAREIKFLLVYQNFVLTGSRLMPANVIEVGGYHVAAAKSLPEDLQQFMNNAERGIIYISFGTNINNSSFTAEQVLEILDAIEHVPYSFIWKWEEKSATVLMDKNKLYVSNWLPQVDILGHPKTQAFFSHAGMAGTTEAIHYGVPMIAMPFFGDQTAIAAAIEEIGLGVRVQLEDLTKKNLVSAIETVITPKFQENVKTLSRAWHDRPLPPLETAVYWTEFAARYSNYTFRAPSADVALYQHLNLDLVLVFSLIIISLIAVVKVTITMFSVSKKRISRTLHYRRKKNT